MNTFFTERVQAPVTKEMLSKKRTGDGFDKNDEEFPEKKEMGETRKTRGTISGKTHERQISTKYTISEKVNKKRADRFEQTSTGNFRERKRAAVLCFDTLPGRMPPYLTTPYLS